MWQIYGFVNYFTFPLRYSFGVMPYCLLNILLKYLAVEKFGIKKCHVYFSFQFEKLLF